MLAPHHRYTWSEYLALDDSCPVKHEFFDGEIYALASGTPFHSALALAVASSLHTQLRGKPCRAYNSDLRLRVMATGLATYPDVSVICGELKFDPEPARTATTVVNPSTIVEVLSDSTEEYDRGAKFENYGRIPTLREYVLVSHREKLIEVFKRATEDAEWIRTEARTGARVSLESIGCELDVDAVYEGVDLSG